MGDVSRRGDEKPSAALVFIASFSAGLLIGMTMFALLRAFVG